MPQSAQSVLTTAISDAVAELTREIQDRISELLEQKHLHQRVKVDFDGIVSKYQAKAPEQFAPVFPDFVEPKFRGDLELQQEGRNHNSSDRPRYILKNLKLHCRKCGAREVFSCIWYHDLGEVNPYSHTSLTSTYPQEKNYQGICLAYQCQRCKSDPTLFIVRRENWTFILEGRSPIEEVEVPSEIPKAERAFFRDSVVAFQSGKTLPAILYLRVFIEAFCRRLTSTVTRESGDELTSRYNNLLKPEQSSQMPSLKKWYERLSEAIHEGREDADLYMEAREEIIRHFEFRRLFRLIDSGA